MAGFIRSNAERVKTKQISTAINKEICEDFKDSCKTMGYPINIMIETFMRQFVHGKFPIKNNKLRKWNKGAKDKIILNTTVNLGVYNDFKDYCKTNGYLINEVITGFMKHYVDEEYIIEFKKVKK